MVAPVSGPYHKYEEVKGAANQFGYRPVIRTIDHYWLRQAKPYNLPLNNYMVRRDFLGSSDGNPAESSDADPPQTNGRALAYNKAYEKVKAFLGDSSMWAVNLAEQDQSLKMIVTRATQLRRFVSSVRRADFIGAAKELKLAAVPAGVKRRKAFANNFLEYHFGWEPLLNDVYGAVNTFLDPHLPTARPFKARATNGQDWLVPPAPFGVTRRGNDKFHVQIAGALEVTNPNLHLASQLGLINPLSVAWELVPFSFVVDWWGNVGNVLSSYTDFAGVSKKNTYVSDYQVTNSQQVWWYGLSRSYRYVLSQRTTGDFPGPSLAIKPFQGLSPVRGITAISLLLQKMK